MNKNVVVTGGTSGIGKAIVLLFLEKGYHVFLLDIVVPTFEHDRLTFIECDVSRVSAITQAIDQLLTSTHQIDVLINNAGIHLSKDIENTTEAEFDQVINTNLKGYFFITQAILPWMKQQKAGVIINMGSDQSFIGKKHSAAYGATKAAIAQLTKSTALDYAKYGIRVNCVCPGTIDTLLYQRALKKISGDSHEVYEKLHREESEFIPIGRVGTPEEVASLTYFLASDEAQFITGSLFSIDGGYTAM